MIFVYKILFTMKSRRGGVRVLEIWNTTSRRRLAGCQPGTELENRVDPIEWRTRTDEHTSCCLGHWLYTRAPPATRHVDSLHDVNIVPRAAVSYV